MPFVLDASICACWAFEDEDDPVADAALIEVTTGDAVVPALWWFEIRNILVVNERRGRVSEEETTIFLGYLPQLRIEVDDSIDEYDVLRLARQYRLTFYDASYLEIAHRRGLPLATLDEPMAKAARAEGVALIGG